MAQQDHRKLERTKTPGIYKRGGSYVVRWKHRGTPTKQHFRTYKEAREFKAKLDGGGDRRAPTRATVETYYEGWIESYRGRTARGLEESTRVEYRNSFASYVLPHLSRMKLREVGSRDVSDWLGWMERRGASPNTIRKARTALGAMLADAAQAGDIPANPVTGVRYVPSQAARERQSKRKRRTLTVADVDAILAAVPAEWRLLFELLAHSGMRVSEALGLVWGHVHLGDDPHLLVTEQVYKGERKRLKTDGSERRIPLSVGMAKALQEWKQKTAHPGDADPVFATRTGRPMSYGNVYNRVLQPALRACGLDGQGIGFHAFRKLAGSVLLKRAAKDPRQVQRWLGHSRLTTTMDVYVHDLDDGLGGADELDGIFGNGEGLHG